MITQYTLACLFFFTPTPVLSDAERTILDACDQTYPQLSVCEDKLKMVKSLSGDRYTVIASCGPAQE